MADVDDEESVPEHEAEPAPEVGAVVAMVYEPDLWSLHCCRGKPTLHTQQQLKERYSGRSSLAPPNYVMQFEALESRGCAQLVVAEGLPARCRRLPRESWPSVVTGGSALKHHDLAYQCAIDGTAGDGPPVPPDAPCQSCNYSLLPNTPDLETWLCQHSPAVLKQAIGGLLGLVDAVLDGSATKGVMIDGSVGHHAHCDHASGYGIYNEVVSAARRAVEKHGLKRVMIFDWDIHCGDGIEKILYDDPNILYCSIHRYEGGMFFPGSNFSPDETGGLDANGLTINVGWGTAGGAGESRGMGDEEYRAAFEAVVLPVTRAFEPQIVLVFGGMDAADGDPVGHCNVSPAMYGWMTRQLMMAACSAPLVVLLTGGYDSRSNKPGPVECVRALLGEPAASSPNFGGGEMKPTTGAFIDLLEVLTWHEKLRFSDALAPSFGSLLRWLAQPGGYLDQRQPPEAMTLPMWDEEHLANSASEIKVIASGGSSGESSTAMAEWAAVATVRTKVAPDVSSVVDTIGTCDCAFHHVAGGVGNEADLEATMHEVHAAVQTYPYWDQARLRMAYLQLRLGDESAARKTAMTGLLLYKLRQRLGGQLHAALISLGWPSARRCDLHRGLQQLLGRRSLSQSEIDALAALAEAHTPMQFVTSLLAQPGRLQLRIPAAAARVLAEGALPAGPHKSGWMAFLEINDEVAVDRDTWLQLCGASGPGWAHIEAPLYDGFEAAFAEVTTSLLQDFVVGAREAQSKGGLEAVARAAREELEVGGHGYIDESEEENESDIDFDSLLSSSSNESIVD